MKNSIKEFYIGKADYFVSDGNGGNIHLVLNYAKNTYEIRSNSTNGIVGKFLREQAKEIATDLLGRKAGINLVNTLRQKGIIK